MPAITIRNLPEETHRALRARAASHGRSTEAEVRAILNEAVTPHEGLATRIRRAVQEAGGGFDIEFPRDPSSTEPIDFR